MEHDKLLSTSRLGDRGLPGDEQNSKTSPANGQSVGKLAHDLRGFLHVIKTSIYVLRASRENEAKFNDILDVIDQDQTAALEKLNQLVDIADRRSLTE